MTAIRTRSGVSALVAFVRTYFAAHGTTANVVLGWKERTKQINQGAGGANRVVFMPSTESGQGGKITGAAQPGTRRIGLPATTNTIRSLFNWERALVVSIWAVDATNLSNEEAQIEAVETLLEKTMQAVQRYPGGANNARWGDTQWSFDNEFNFGLELRVGLTFKHPIFDASADIVFPTPLIEPEMIGEAG